MEQFKQAIIFRRYPEAMTPTTRTYVLRTSKVSNKTQIKREY
tara:strand:- start:5865 stop:5990 length:126 start_codon:yes stop_codon:yes gene_type:complete